MNEAPVEITSFGRGFILIILKNGRFYNDQGR